MKKQTLKLVLAVCVLIAVAFTATAVANEDEHSQDDKDKKKTSQEEYKKKKQEEVRDKKEALSEKKEKSEQRKHKLKKDVCEERKDKLEAKVPRLGNGAANLQEVFDKVYERVQNFHDNNQLNVANYDTLKAAVDSSQANAETAVNAAKDYKVDIDCENPDLAGQLAEYREKVKTAKEALKDYRASLVLLIKAVKETAKETDNG